MNLGVADYRPATQVSYRGTPKILAQVSYTLAKDQYLEPTATASVRTKHQCGSTRRSAGRACSITSRAVITFTYLMPYKSRRHRHAARNVASVQRHHRRGQQRRRRQQRSPVVNGCHRQVDVSGKQTQDMSVLSRGAQVQLGSIWSGGSYLFNHANLLGRAQTIYGYDDGQQYFGQSSPPARGQRAPASRTSTPRGSSSSRVRFGFYSQPRRTKNTKKHEEEQHLTFLREPGVFVFRGHVVVSTLAIGYGTGD